MITITNPTILDSTNFLGIAGSNQKKIIFWDACTILDIIRLPIRNQNSNTLAEIVEIRNNIVADINYSISSEICIKEIENNYEYTKNEVINNFKKISDQYNQAFGFIEKAGLAPSISAVDLNQYNLPKTLTLIAEEILQKTIFIEASEFAKKGLDRDGLRLPPSKIKSQTKDCIIWCSALGIKIKLGSHSSNFIFASSNTTDYYNNGRLDPVIDGEAKSSGIDFCTNLNHLYALQR